MPAPSMALTSILFLGGIAAGGLGSLLGLGGGVFLVPLLVLVMDVPMRVAVGISLTTIIATSSVTTSGSVGRSLINLRLGMLLEVATTVGGLTGGLVAVLISQRRLQQLFGVVAAAGAAIMLSRLGKRNVLLDPAAEPGRLGGRYYEEESRGVVTYQVKRLPLALFVSLAAGSVSSLLGIGGGMLKVPALNAWCGVPLRAAAATSAFMIGVTATVGAVIYYGRGEIVPWMAAAAILGVMVGSRAGFRIGAAASARWLKLLLAIVLVIVSILMFLRAR
ncbi:MAG TPA: sulfite exporter TauE/SafE family protein [Vicinamibacterales bacterium]|nr:sulfite exporter TauE/SafE family protein [Acidobacteriota bacterium]HOC17319.1 sulfite exporter TauE/SafE family protein [Vicinamibacterales bacterium]